jgi:hypothetical protein
MNYRTRTLWVPSLVSLAGSATAMLMLQRSVSSPQTGMRLSHAGLPLIYQLMWLATLPLFGAAAAFLSRRAGGDRRTAFIVALFPSIVMIPLWTILATRMSHPSTSQWFGLFWGVVNWIVLPGLALSLGASPFLRVHPMNVHSMKDIERKKTPRLNARIKSFWFPSLVSLTTAMAALAASTFAGLQPQFVARGLATFVVYVPWLLLLPLCGGAGAYLSRRVGAERRVCLAAGLFPVIVLTGLVGLLTLAGKFVYAKPQFLYFSVSVLLGAILPGVALLLGAIPFAKTRPAQAAS